MSAAGRLPPLPGEWLDRSQALEFRFEGRNYRGFAGDTVSSALLASGRRVLGRSFKYHRPRGILSAANHDVNTMVQDGPRINLRADVEPLVAGMNLRAVNTFGGLDRDRAGILDRLSPFLPVGFYYKAFHSKALFPRWEKLFRTLTGLGRIDTQAPRRATPKRYAFCDVLVVGAGPSGLAAAVAAADAGAEVVLVDENPHAGGSGHYQLGGDWRQRDGVSGLIGRMGLHPRIRFLGATQAVGYYADHWVPLLDGEKITKMRARAVVMATGAYEQPAVFRNNDLPGVMLSSAAQRLIYRYGVLPMTRAVVLAANGDGYRAALDLLAQGGQVAALVDLRAGALPDDQVALAAALKARGVSILPGSMVVEAVAGRLASGERCVAAARVCPLGQDGEPDWSAPSDIACDGILMGVGWAPTANLLYQAGTAMAFDGGLEQFVPATLPDGVFACGRVNGVYRLADRFRDGERAGWAAAAHALGLSKEEGLAPVPRESVSPNHPWPMVAHPRGKNFVDFDEDICLKDLYHAAQEGFDNIELLKRYTTTGMGPSQGKHSNMNALRILARITGQSPQAVGTTTARPFFHPVPMSHLAGRGFSPQRETPMEAAHQALGAVWMPAGVWQRPAYYARPGEDRGTSIAAEVAAVRTAAGLIDVGTLGKLEVRGPDAAAFLERVYTGRFANLKVGMTRYGVMCDEAGTLIDDGVIARLGPEHFYFTTTTANSAPIYRELSRLNALWRMDVGLVQLTGALAAMNLAGPKARAVLADCCDLDLGSDAFPFLAVRETVLRLPSGPVPARLMRVGFVGEWGVEIHVPANQGAALWQALLQAGVPHGLRPFGVEAQRRLRLEKGHLIIGQDSDGLTQPYEVGLGWALKMDKPFFVGQRSLRILAAKPPRQQLVGFVLPAARPDGLPEECHLVVRAGEITGRVTSIAWSDTLGQAIGLAFVAPDQTAPGTEFSIRGKAGQLILAEVVPLPFYDPENRRQQA